MVSAGTVCRSMRSDGNEARLSSSNFDLLRPVTTKKKMKKMLGLPRRRGQVEREVDPPPQQVNFLASRRLEALA